MLLGSRAMTGAATVSYFSVLATSPSFAACCAANAASRSCTFSSVSRSTSARSAASSVRRRWISVIACTNRLLVTPTSARTRWIGTRSGDARVEAAQQRATAREVDALVHDVSDELGRRLLDRLLDRVDDLLDRRLDGLADLRARHLDRSRQASEEIATAEERRDLFIERVRGSDRDLDVLGGALAHEQIELASRVGNDVAVHFVATHADRARDDDPTERGDRDLGRAATDVDDHRT